MSECINASNVMTGGLSCLSAEELRGVEGGLKELYESVLDESSYEAFYKSIASWCQVLASISRGERP